MKGLKQGRQGKDLDEIVEKVVKVALSNRDMNLYTQAEIGKSTQHDWS